LIHFIFLSKKSKSQYKFVETKKINLHFNPTQNNEDLNWKNLNKVCMNPDEILINLFNKTSNSLEIHRIKLNKENLSDIINYEMIQVDCIIKLNEKSYELHECSQFTSLDNILIIYDDSYVYYINITTNKVIIKQKLNFSLSKILNIENSNDIITFYDDINVETSAENVKNKNKKASLFYVKLVQSVSNPTTYELLVIEKVYYKKIDDIKLNKNQLVVLCGEKSTFEIYSVDFLLENSLFEPNPLTLNFNAITNDFVNSFEITPNSDYLSIFGEELLIYLIKISTNRVIAVIPLQVYYKNLITSNKFVSIFSPAEGFTRSFLIIDHLEQDHLKRIDELKLNKSFA
jgi:hypothetical protein